MILDSIFSNLMIMFFCPSGGRCLRHKTLRVKGCKVPYRAENAFGVRFRESVCSVRFRTASAAELPRRIVQIISFSRTSLRSGLAAEAIFDSAQDIEFILRSGLAAEAISTSSRMSYLLFGRPKQSLSLLWSVSLA
jgi:hypothetical protein